MYLNYTSIPLQFTKFFFLAILLPATSCLRCPLAVTVNNRATTTSPPTANLISSQVVDLKLKQKSFATTAPQCPQVLRLRCRRINLVVAWLLLLRWLPLHPIDGDLRTNQLPNRGNRGRVRPDLPELGPLRPRGLHHPRGGVGGHEGPLLLRYSPEAEARRARGGKGRARTWAKRCRGGGWAAAPEGGSAATPKSGLAVASTVKWRSSERKNEEGTRRRRRKGAAMVHMCGARVSIDHRSLPLDHQVHYAPFLSRSIAKRA